MLTVITPTTSTTYLLLAYFVFGIGCGLVNPPITNTAVSGMPPSQAGVAAAVASTSRSVGLTLGVAVLGAISGGAISGAVGPGFAAATHAAWWISAGLGALCLVLGVLTTTRWAENTARHTAELFRDEEPPSVGRPGRAASSQRELAHS
jgi:MFS family permease